MQTREKKHTHTRTHVRPNKQKTINDNNNEYDHIFGFIGRRYITFKQGKCRIYKKNENKPKA